MPNASPVSPGQTSDLLLRAAELLQLGIWTQDELTTIGWDHRKLDELVRKMEAELVVFNDDSE